MEFGRFWAARLHMALQWCKCDHVDVRSRMGRNSPEVSTDLMYRCRPASCDYVAQEGEMPTVMGMGEGCTSAQFVCKPKTALRIKAIDKET